MLPPPRMPGFEQTDCSIRLAGMSAGTFQRYIDWATLMRRGLGIDVLDCPLCHGRMRPIAVIESEDAVEKIMAHLSLPLKPEEPANGTVVYDVTGDDVLASPVWWGDDEAGCGTGPPGEWDGVDPPSPAA